MSIKERTQVICLLSIILLLFGLVGEGDFEDEVATQKHYCKMVIEGRWQNYNHVNCEGR